MLSQEAERSGERDQKNLTRRCFARGRSMSLSILDSQGQWSKSHWPRIHCVICFPSGLTINITIQYFPTLFKIKQFRRQPAFTNTVTVQGHQAFGIRPAKRWVVSAF